MIISMINSFFELFTHEGNCECCGSPCKTALCSDCREDLVTSFDNQNHNIFTLEPEAQQSFA